MADHETFSVGRRLKVGKGNLRGREEEEEAEEEENLSTMRGAAAALFIWSACEKKSECELVRDAGQGGRKKEGTRSGLEMNPLETGNAL